jgi:hypothetical protein
MSHDTAGCVAKLLILLVWGFIAEALFSYAFNMYFAEHSWYTLPYIGRYFIGVFFGKIAVIAIIIGFILSVGIQMPIF